MVIGVFLVFCWGGFGAGGGDVLTSATGGICIPAWCVGGGFLRCFFGGCDRQGPTPLLLAVMRLEDPEATSILPIWHPLVT